MKKRFGEKLPLKRIKSIMQTNKDIGKIQKQTPQLIGWAIEAFIEELTCRAHKISEANGDAKITPSHIKEVIVNGGGGGGSKVSAEVKSSYGYLKAGLAGIPDLNKKAPSKTVVVETEEQQPDESSHLSASPPQKKGGVRRK